jgi:ATP-dependent Clp protease adaptor protein ClpS
MDEPGETAIAEPVIETVRRQKERESQKPKRQPRYHVVLWDDDEHSYEYVMLMMQELFGHELERGFEIAKKIDRDGRTIVLTTTMEHAELKRDQIHSYGRDVLIERCLGSMSASIEPEVNDGDR